MKFKHILIIIGCCLLMGCSSDSKDTSYKGLDAKETYEKAIENMNKDIRYYKVYEKREGDQEIQSTTEVYYEDGVKNLVIVSKDHTYNYTYANVYGKDDIYEMGQDNIDKTLTSFEVDEEVKQSTLDAMKTSLFTPITKNKAFDILDIQRKEENNDIVIETQYKHVEYFAEEDGTEVEYISYFQTQCYIGENGYINKEVITNYEDENFENVLAITTVTYQDFNKKTSFNYQQEVNKFKELEGKDVKELDKFFE